VSQDANEALSQALDRSTNIARIVIEIREQGIVKDIGEVVGQPLVVLDESLKSQR
jgi:hypothetical protein